MIVDIGQRRIDLGEATEEQTIALAIAALDLVSEEAAIELVGNWIKAHGLEGAF